METIVVRYQGTRKPLVSATVGESTGRCVAQVIDVVRPTVSHLDAYGPVTTL